MRIAIRTLVATIECSTIAGAGGAVFLRDWDGNCSYEDIDVCP